MSEPEDRVAEIADPTGAPTQSRRIVWAVGVVGVALSLFQLYGAGIEPLGLFYQRSIHLAFIMAMTFLMFPVFGSRGRGALGWAIDAVFLAAAVASGWYIVWNLDAIFARAGFWSQTDIWMGMITTVAVLEASRRAIGLANDADRGGGDPLWPRRPPRRAAVAGRMAARPPVAPRQQLRPPRGAAIPRAGGDLRPAAGRGRHLHLRLRALRRVPRGDGRGQVLHRPRLRRDGAQAGRPGQGGGAGLGRNGVDQRLGDRQCRDHRRLHDPADEAARLQARPGRRDRGRGLDRRADHPATDGRGRFPDLGIHPRSLHPYRPRLDLSGDPLPRHRLPLRPHRRDEARDGGDACGRASRRARRAQGGLAVHPAALHPDLPAGAEPVAHARRLLGDPVGRCRGRSPARRRAASSSTPAAAPPSLPPG